MILKRSSVPMKWGGSLINFSSFCEDFEHSGVFKMRTVAADEIPRFFRESPIPRTKMGRVRVKERSPSLSLSEPR